MHFDPKHPPREFEVGFDVKRIIRGREEEAIPNPLARLFDARAYWDVIVYWLLVAPQKATLASLEAQIDQARKNKREMENLRRLILDAEEMEAEQIIWLDELHDVLSCLP